jgi:hypothetical protein
MGQRLASRPPAFILIGALALCACGADLASPFSAVAITYDTNRQAYKLAQVRINTLTSLRHLEGSAGVVQAGGEYRVVTSTLRSSGVTPPSLRDAFAVALPAVVDLTWNTLNDIVYPEDFASLELLSTYYNMEKARAALSGWGLPDQPTVPVLAHTLLTDDTGLSPLPDGELYYAPLAIFVAPAATPQEQVPAAFNLGAVAHAVVHQAIENLVWAGAVLPPTELSTATDAASITARHLVRSMSEGLADYMGVSVSGDTHWFDHSLQLDAPARALDFSHCGTPDMESALSVDDAQARYDPYPLGSVIASALWDEGSATTNENTARGVLAALPDLGKRAAANPISLGMVLDTLAAHAPADQLGDLCGMLIDRFANLKITASDLPSCSGAKVVPHSECM